MKCWFQKVKLEMIFKTLQRSCLIEGGWRLATVAEAQQNLESIKGLLKERDRARLLDGWMEGSIYDFHAEVGFRSCLGYMLLVKPPLQDDMMKYRYSEVTLSEEGMRAALFLCTEDWNYEVVYWLLECWSKIEQAVRWESIESCELVNASKQVSALAIELQFLHSTDQVSRSIEQASISQLSENSMKGLVSNFVKFVGDRTDDHSLREVLSRINPRDVAKSYCIQTRLTDDVEIFQMFRFNTTTEGTWQAIADTVCHFVINSMAVRIIREWVIGKNVASDCDRDTAYIVSYANELLNRAFCGDNDLGTMVREAADTAKGDLELLKDSLREQGHGIFSCAGSNSFLHTVLVQAAKKGEEDVVEKLIKIGVEPLESDDAKRKTALHYAAKLSNEDKGYIMVKMLFRGATNETLANVPDYKKRTPLHRAAFSGNASICNLLIEHRASVSAKDNNDQIPLHHALTREKQNEEVIRVLISAHSSVDAEDSDGRTPLEYAVEYQENVGMITNLLLPHFAKPGAYIKKLDLASCLREASRKGHLEIVKMLLENEANPLDRDKEGKTALHYAAEGNVDQQALDISHQLVLDEYKQVNNVELAKACDKHGRSVLHFAASCGHRRLCEWVLSQDIIDVDGKDRDGRSALYYAVGGKHDDAQLLDVWRRRRSSRQAINMFDLKDFKNTTPLHLAAEKGNLKMVENILSKVKQRDREKVVRAADVLGLTALHKAATGGHALVVGKLLSEGAHPLTERDCDGKTALHYAVQAENVVDAREVATLLLKSCHSQKVKFLLLNAFAFGTGFAEESDGCNSSLEKYLLEEKHKIWSLGETGNLLKVADILNDEQMVNELLSKGIDIEQIRSYEFREPRDKQNVQKVQDQMDTINNLFEEDTDKPALQDNLGRSAFVNGLASLFLNPSVSSPITVGISGEWGMGKSSVMLQVESILLKTAAHLAVSSSLRKEDIPGTSNSKSFGCGEAKCGNIIGIVENFVKRLFYTVKNLMKVLCGRNENDIGKGHIKILRNILSTYQRDSHQVFKSLAVAKRRNMIPIGRTKKEQESIRDDKIPSILTVRYNAWQYRSQTEAWAGLGVEIIKELEAAMTVTQRLSSSWRYNWASRKRTLCVEVFLPCFLAVIVAVWVTVIIWFLLDRVKDHSKDFKFASLPITLIAVSWAAVKSVMSVVKPVSSTVVDYLCFPDHSQKLGYHQKVIDDINFLKKELGHRPSRIWSFYAFIWCWTPFYSWETYVPKTTIPKMIPAPQENLRMVVFVDDLDRCHENVILEILSAINLVLSVCEINVVMAMDKTLIEKAIERKFGNRQNKSDKSGPDLADKYLRKLIQLPLDLPDPSPSDYNIFLQRQLGVLAKKKAATHSEEVTGKFSSKARKATFNSRNSGLGKATASLEETGVRKRRYHTSGRDDMAGELEEITEVSVRGERQIPGGESTNITIPDNELPTKRIEEDNGGDKSWVHTCFNKLPSFLVCNPHEEIDNEQEWMKFFSATISTTIDFEILKRKYSPAERDAFCFLHIQVTGSRRLPREWKRLKNYHRLVWNILYKSTQVKTLRGWQVQLIAWVFICWQWKNQINTLIQSWHELSVFQEDDPWLRDIVEHYIDERWPPPPLKIDGLAHGDVKNTINRRVNKSVESENSETMSKEEDTRRKNYLPVVRRVLEKKKQLKDQALEDGSSPEELEDRSTPEEEELIDLVDTVHQVLQQANNRLKGKNNESTGKCEEVGEGEGSLEQARMIKDKDEQNPKASQKNTGKAKVAKVDKEEEEHKEWINLRETLKRYDVSIKSILVFQDFRFYCVPRNLGWQLPKSHENKT